jgi:hypothetical protein
MGIVLGLVALLTVWGVHNAYARDYEPKIRVPDLDAPGLKRWEPYVKIAATVARVPWEVAYAWIGIESEGNPCAVGEKTATAPDGYPKEIGLVQFYNPDDLRRLGAKPSELCAYCVRPQPGEPNPQKLARAMTPAEIGRHVGLSMAFIRDKQADADHYLVLHHVPWATQGADYWRMVKLVHALPSIVHTGLGQVVAKLGRPPTSWWEFRTTYETINPRARYNPKVKKQDGYWRALANAEWTGGQFVDHEGVV